MKIIYIVPELNSKGGVQEFAKSIYSELKNKFNLEIINWKYDLSLLIEVILRCFPPKIGAYLYYNIFSNHFRKKYILKSINLIHFWWTDPAMAFLNKKYVISCYGIEILKKNVRGFRKELYPKVFYNALLIHADSDYAKELLVKEFGVPKKKIIVIHPSIDFFKLSKIKKIKQEKTIIGTLSRFVKRKNILNIIKSLNILKEKKNIDFIYYLAGDGPERKRILKDLDKAKFEWKYFGEISEEKKIKEFYPSLDVFVMPPLELPNSVEGFGIVYLEANAYGIPVVASRTGGVPDAVNENVSGVFADPTIPEDIAVKILKVLRNKDKYYESARNWAKKFDVKKISSEFAKIYNEIEK